MTEEKCYRCGFPISQIFPFVKMDGEKYCIQCYLKITQFKWNGDVE